MGGRSEVLSLGLDAPALATSINGPPCSRSLRAAGARLSRPLCGRLGARRLLRTDALVDEARLLRSALLVVGDSLRPALQRVPIEAIR